MTRRYHPGDAVIIGFGDAYARMGEGRKPLDLAGECVRKALADSGIDKQQLDAVFTGRAPWADMRPQWNNILASYLKIVSRHGTEVTVHGAGVNSTLKHAALAVVTGVSEFALCLETDSAAMFSDAVARTARVDADPNYELPYGAFIPAVHAQWCSRYCHEYGVTDEERALVAVQHQNWAVHHPYAVKAEKGTITVRQVLESPLVASPLRLWECSRWGPGGTGGAFIVTTREKAAELGVARPVEILGFGECCTHEYITDRLGLRDGPAELGPLPNLLYTGAAVAGRMAYDVAGIGPDDIDIVQLGAPFTHYVLMLLEDLGFCDRGQARKFIADGRGDVGGDLPVNTNGGWISFGQPGISCAMDSLVEAVRQLRGQALGKQVDDPRIALVHATGGMMACNAVTLLGVTGQGTSR